MRSNIKLIVAIVIAIGAVVWAVTSVRSMSYSGTNLNFPVGSGPVKVNNTGDAPVTVQLVSPGTRSFTVTTTIEGAGGTSVKQGTGAATTQLFEVVLPSGVNTFTVTRGTGVTVAAQSETRLEVTVQPLPESDTRMTLIIAAVVILGSLFYASKTTGHRWISMLRNRVTGKTAPVPVIPVVATAAAGQGPEMRAYGDNRADITPRS
jgi:hypothetical protein